jgi:hypothetical protein
MKAKMKPNMLELFDQALLQVMEANTTRFGLTAEALRAFCRAQGFEPEEKETLDRLEYLAGKGLAAAMPKLIDKSTRVWKITAAGRLYLDERNL